MDLGEIILPIASELHILENRIEKLLSSDYQLVNELVKHINGKKGKRIRSCLMFLLGKSFDDIDDKLINYAALVEILHNATLIHDDVVDNANERRGVPSVNAKWNNKVSVLLGDYLFAKGFKTVYSYNDFEMLNIFSETISTMSEGELYSIQLSNSNIYSEDSYYKIIYSKTAILIESACKITAMLHTKDKTIIDTLSEFGKNIGMSFQLTDDIFDYLSVHQLIGKPIGNDIREKQITLPLIYSLNNTDDKQKEQFVEMIKKPLISNEEISLLINFAMENNGLEYTKQKAKYFSNEAIKKLDIFPNSEIKEKLIHYANFIVERNK